MGVYAPGAADVHNLFFTTHVPLSLAPSKPHAFHIRRRSSIEITSVHENARVAIHNQHQALLATKEKTEATAVGPGVRRNTSRTAMPAAY